ncbi:MAG: hypothetical protein R6X25_11300 [Candidatus Krumholzibacteriia bacterium]
MTEPRRGTDDAREQRRRRLLGLLGLARRAGKLAMGQTAVDSLVARQQRPVVVLALDAGDALRRRVERLEPLRGCSTDLVTRSDLATLGGRDDLAVVATADASFVRGIGELIRTAAGDGDPGDGAGGSPPGERAAPRRKDEGVRD